MRPMFPYFGSSWFKARDFPAPEHDEVWELFAGSAGYSLRHDVKRARLIDASPVIVGVWDYLIHAAETEILALPDIAFVGDSVDNYNLPQEAKWLIGFWLNRGSASPKKSRTAYSARNDGQLIWGPRAKDRIASQQRHIREWTVQQGSYADGPPPSVPATRFIDPPYVDKGKYYPVNFHEHGVLGLYCLECRGLVMVCEGPGADWLPFKTLGSYKSSLGHADEYIFIQRSPDHVEDMVERLFAA